MADFRGNLVDLLQDPVSILGMKDVFALNPLIRVPS